MATTDNDKVEAEAAEAEEAPATREYLEYVGDDPFGIQFLNSHTIPRGDMLWRRNQLTVNKDITWERDPTLAGIGQKGNRMLVPVEDLPKGAAEVLEKLPQYKRVNE